jgi:hypothetical protein
MIVMMTMMMMTVRATEEYCFIPSHYKKQRFGMCWYLPAPHRRAQSSFSGAGVKATLDASQSQHQTRSSASTCFIPVSCLAYYSTMKMRAICSSETSVDIQQTTLRYIPKDRTLVPGGKEAGA